MASSTNSSTRATWIRYANRFCSCGQIAEIRVSTAKETPNRLYYTCKKDACNWSCWCEPIPEFTTNPFQGKDPTQVDIELQVSKLFEDLNLHAVAQDAENEEIRDEIRDMKSVFDDKLDVLKKQFSTQISSLKAHVENASEDELSKLRKEFEKQMKKDIRKMVFALILVLLVVLFNKTN